MLQGSLDYIYKLVLTLPFWCCIRQFVQANSSYYARFTSAFDKWDNFDGNFLGNDCLYVNSSGQVSCDPKITISVTTKEVNFFYEIRNNPFRTLVTQISSTIIAHRQVTLASSIMATSNVQKNRKSTIYSISKFPKLFTLDSISWPACTNLTVMKYSLPG